MSERACNEAIANMYNDITEIRGQNSGLKNDIVEISTNIKWMMEGIDTINKKLDSCAACKNPEEIIKKIDSNKKDINELKDSHHSIKYTAVGVSAGISIITAIILFILKFKEVI